MGFQGLCLENSEGSLYMVSCFDRFPRSTRDLLNASRFNICAACFGMCGGGWHDDIAFDRYLLNWFEAAIRGECEPPDRHAYSQWRDGANWERQREALRQRDNDRQRYEELRRQQYALEQERERWSTPRRWEP